MTREEFASELEFIFGVAEGSLAPETELASLKAWDSTGMLSILVLLDQIGSPVKPAQLREAKTIGDLAALAGDKLT